MNSEPKTLKEIEEEVAVSIARNASVTGATGGYGTFSPKPETKCAPRHVGLAIGGVLAFLFFCYLIRCCQRLNLPDYLAASPVEK